jgi:hypothetical protein
MFHGPTLPHLEAGHTHDPGEGTLARALDQGFRL